MKKKSKLILQMSAAGGRIGVQKVVIDSPEEINTILKGPKFLMIPKIITLLKYPPPCTSKDLFFLNSWQLYWPIAFVSRLFDNGPEDQGSIPGQDIQKIKKWFLIHLCFYGGARCVMFNVVGNGHGDTCSNPGRG